MTSTLPILIFLVVVGSLLEGYTMNLTKNEEDYLKALFYLIVEQREGSTGTNQLAEYLKITPSSVNGMLKRLKTKDLVTYEKYGKLNLTPQGGQIALELIRRHRLWETFLYNYMNFTWDEVHEVAEQLEHVSSQKLIDELEKFLGFPTQDPHGAKIPSKNGEYQHSAQITLAELKTGSKCRVTSVRDISEEFLKYVTFVGISLNSELEILEKHSFDASLRIKINGEEKNISKKFAENVFVDPLSS